MAFVVATYPAACELHKETTMPTDTKNEKLIELIYRATTGRYSSSLDGIALGALEMIGDEINMLTFAMCEDNHDVANIPADQLEANLSYLGTRAAGIAALLQEAKNGRLTLDVDEENPAAEGTVRQ